MRNKVKRWILELVVRLANKYEYLAPDNEERNSLIADKNWAIRELDKMNNGDSQDNDKQRG